MLPHVIASLITERKIWQCHLIKSTCIKYKVQGVRKIFLDSKVKNNINGKNYDQYFLNTLYEVFFIKRQCLLKKNKLFIFIYLSNFTLNVCLLLWIINDTGTNAIFLLFGVILKILLFFWTLPLLPERSNSHLVVLA